MYYSLFWLPLTAIEKTIWTQFIDCFRVGEINWKVEALRNKIK